MAPFSTLLAATVDASPTGPLLTPYGWVAFGLIMVAGLIVGWSDLARLSWTRIWALSGTCFTESMRRRVLLVTPLAIAGVIVVVQLQRATDEQDSIRQTIKFCLFASGLLVTLVALILACSNLPREIENRVIYTIVTKPTTRLEIVLGKIVGFARVSAVVLLIMGLFTFVFLKFRNWTMVHQMQGQLVTEATNSARRPTMQHYIESGFLSTKSLNAPADVHVYSRMPGPAATVRWMRGGENQYFLLPFELTEADQETLKSAGQQNVPVTLIFNVQIERHTPTPEEQKVIRELNLVAPLPKNLSGPLGPELPTTTPATGAAAPEAPAQVRVRFLDEARRQIIKTDEVESGSGITLHSQSDKGPSGFVNLAPQVVERLAANQRFFAEVTAITPAVEYGIGEKPADLYVPTAKDQGVYIRSAADLKPQFLATTGRRGMLITPSLDVDRSIAVYQFRNAANAASGGKVAFQLDASFEKSADSSAEATPLAQISVDVTNRKTGASSGSINVAPDLNRITYFDVPEADVEGGDFDVALRNRTPGQQLGVGFDSLSMITADRSFAVNLSKSMLVLWMMSVLVVAISVFCSTFLSWPIAVVLTLVILLGRWGVLELGDALNPGVGRFVSADLQLSDPTTNLLMSNSIEALTKLLKAVSVVLPDVSRFPVLEDIERGISITTIKLTGAAGELLVYGLGMAIASYLILKFKEVAP